MKKITHRLRVAAVLIVLGVNAGALQAATVPFSEDFSTGSANWIDNASQPLGWSPTGGADDGGFSISEFNFAGSQANADVVMIRGSLSLASSNGAMFGDWLADEVTGFSTYVRHNAPAPLTFFARFASPQNFPGAVAINFAPVFPSQWTLVQIPIDPSNPQFVTFENSTFDGVFDGVGNIQLGVRVPEGLAGADLNVEFGVDRISIVPEPAALALLGVGAVFLAIRRRTAQ